MAEVVSVRNLAFSYARVPVWEDVTFSLKEGEIAILVGANGSGKSTLLRCLAGWLRPSSGDIQVVAQGPRPQVAFVCDVPAFYDDLTAKEHMELLLRAGGVEGESAYATDLLRSLKLADALDRYPSAYSRGMRQKLALALALVIRPRLLLLDEPYAPLDEEATYVFDRELTVAAGRGTAILMSCHASVSAVVASQTLCLRDGRLERG